MAYEKALKETETLFPCNSVRLNIGLNYSHFVLDICKDKEKAMSIAKDIYNKACAVINTIEPGTNYDEKGILTFLEEFIDENSE